MYIQIYILKSYTKGNHIIIDWTILNVYGNDIYVDKENRRIVYNDTKYILHDLDWVFNK